MKNSISAQTKAKGQQPKKQVMIKKKAKPIQALGGCPVCGEYSWCGSEGCPLDYT
jgi:hypothetical protein